LNLNLLSVSRWIEDRGIDSDRMMIVPVTTVQQFRTQAIKILDKYSELNDKKPMMFVFGLIGYALYQ